MPQKTGPSLKPVIVVAIGCAFFLGMMLMFFKSKPGTDTPMVKSLYNAKAICVACRKYALDHGGTFPPSLDALFPTYLTDRAQLTSPLMPSEPDGYTYKAGLKAPVATDTVLIEDRFAPLSHHRVVSYADGSARILDEP